MNSGNSHHGNALPCNTVSQHPMGQRAMHEGGFRKNVLRNLLLMAGEIVSSIVTEIKGRHFELVQGQGLEHRFEKYLCQSRRPVNRRRSIDLVIQLKLFWTRCVAQDARFQQR